MGRLSNALNNSHPSGYTTEDDPYYLDSEMDFTDDPNHESENQNVFEKKINDSLSEAIIGIELFDRLSLYNKRLSVNSENVSELSKLLEKILEAEEVAQYYENG